MSRHHATRVGEREVMEFSEVEAGIAASAAAASPDGVHQPGQAASHVAAHDRWGSGWCGDVQVPLLCPGA